MPQKLPNSEKSKTEVSPMMIMKRVGEDSDFQGLEMRGSDSSIYSDHFAEEAKFIECYDAWHSCLSIVVVGPDLPNNLGAMLRLEPHYQAKTFFLFLLESRLQVL